MGTSEPAVPVGGTGTAAGGTVRYSVPEAARALGISERAVRKRVGAGTLFAVRDGRAWAVYLEEPAGGTAPASAAVPAVPTEPGAEPPAVPRGTVDLAPLADLIADLTRRNERLTEAAAVWQVRALQAEERLKQLTAGPTGEASEVGAGENAAPGPLQRAEFIAARGQGAAEGVTPGVEPSTGSAPQEAPQRAWWAFWRR